MSDINNFVRVDIRLQTGAVSQAGFGTILVAGYHTMFPERVRFYTDLDSLIADGFDPEGGLMPALIYNAAKAIMAAKPKPERFAVGRLSVTASKATILEAVEGRVYKAYLNGEEASYTAGVTPTVDSIATGLVAALVALAIPDVTITASGGATGSYTVTEDEDGAATSFKVDSNQILETLTKGSSITVDLSTIVAEQGDWYGLILASRVTDEQEEAADWIQTAADPKRAAFASNSSDMRNLAPGSDTTSIAAVLKAKSYIKSMTLWHGKADGTVLDEFADAAWLAMALSYNPDVETATEKFKVLPGITPDVITPTQRQNLIGTEESPVSGKNSNIYTVVAERGCTQSGISAGGEWNDVVMGADWLKLRMEERIFNTLRNAGKVPYTPDGINAIAGEMRAQLIIAQDTKFLAVDTERWDKNFGFSIEIPKYSKIPPADRANRILKGLKFYGTVAGAIHAAKPIMGTLVP